MEATWTLIARFDEDFRTEVGIDVKTHDALLHVFRVSACFAPRRVSMWQESKTLWRST